MSKPISIDIRSPANRGFVQGYPGIPVSSRTEPRRPPCTVSGTVEIQASRGQKAVLLKISLVKRETLPSDVGVTSFCEDISPAVTLWSCPPNEDHGILDSVKVFPFSIDLPPSLPPTIDLISQPRTRAPNGRPISFDVSQSGRRPPGINYYLEVTLLEKPKKKGFMRKESQGIEKAVQPIEIWPHDLHSDWPIYNVPKNISAQGSQVYMALTLPQTSFSPSSTLSLPFILHPLPTQTQPIALKHITLTLLETVTFRTSQTNSFSSSGPSRPEAMPGMMSGKKNPSRLTSSPLVTVVAQSRTEIPNDSLFPEDKSGKRWNLMLKLPPSASTDTDASLPGGGESSSRGRVNPNGLRWTVRNGKHVNVKFYIGVEVWGIKGYQTQLLGSIKDVEVVIDWEETGEGKQRTAEIGYVEALCRLNRGFTTTTTTSASALTPISTPPTRSFNSIVSEPSITPPPSQASGFFSPGLMPSPLSLSPRSSSIKAPSQIPHLTGSPQLAPESRRHSLSQSGTRYMPTAVRSASSSWETAATTKNPTEQDTVIGSTNFSREGLLRSNDSSSPSVANRRVSLMNGSSRAVSGPLATDRMKDQTQGTRRSTSVSVDRPTEVSSPSLPTATSPLPSSPLLTTRIVVTTATDMDRTGSPGPKSPAFHEEDDCRPIYRTAEQEKALLFQRAQSTASNLSANTASFPTPISTVPPLVSQYSSSSGPSSSQLQSQVGSQSGRSSGQISVRQDSPQVFESAEQEKRRLFLEAQRRVNETHAGASAAVHPPASALRSHSSRETEGVPNIGGSKSSPSQQKWETAEQEKARLFQEAKTRVAVTQAGGGHNPMTASASSPSSFPSARPLSSDSVSGGKGQVVPHRFSSIPPAASYVSPNELHRLSSHVGPTSQLGSSLDSRSSTNFGRESLGREPVGLTNSMEEGRWKDGLMSYESLFGKQDGNGTGELGVGGTRSNDTSDRMSTPKVIGEKDRLKLFHAAQEAVAARHSQPATTAAATSFPSSSSYPTAYDIPSSSTGYTSSPIHTPALFPSAPMPSATTNGVTQKITPPVLPVRPPVEYAAKYIDPAFMGTISK